MTHTRLFNEVTLVCEANSWILPYVEILNSKLKEKGVKSCVIADYSKIQSGEAVFFLGCTTICPDKFLVRNPFNFIVHESALPKGRGFAPVSWSILDGHDKLVISLIEALTQVDCGKIYSQYTVPLRGNELCAELREIQGLNTIRICLDFVLNGSLERGIEQQGSPTYYRRRTPADSELDVHKSIAEQFNLLRIVDNNRYPAFIIYKGRKYYLRIEDVGSFYNE